MVKDRQRDKQQEMRGKDKIDTEESKGLRQKQRETDTETRDDRMADE